MLNEIDQLSYTYDTDNKNLLLKVDDASNSPQGFKDNYASTGNDYSYDANGNMIADQNKDIHGIAYNHLNLPVQITISGTTNGTISYLYNALGQKVKKTVNNGVSVHTDYLSGFQYQNEVLDFFPHAEGYVKATEMMVFMGGRSYGFNYVFNYTDHLGNIRLSYSKDPSTQVLKIIEENHYYPFGLKHTGYNSDEQMYAKDGSLIRIRPVPPLFTTSYDYKYNGQEYQDELGLNMYDYGARNYDPSIGRWMNIDPLAEQGRRWSPYNYAMNNPIYFLDPDGMLSQSFIDDMWNKSGDGETKWVNNDNGSFSSNTGESIETEESNEGNEIDGNGGSDKKNEPKPKEDNCTICPDYDSDGESSWWEWTVDGLLYAGDFLLGGPTGESLVIKGALMGVTKKAVVKTVTKVIPKGFKHVKKFGYKHGQKVYSYKGKYYSKDVDSHNGGVWKVFEEVNGKLKRIGTADENLKIFKD